MDGESCCRPETAELGKPASEADRLDAECDVGFPLLGNPQRREIGESRAQALIPHQDSLDLWFTEWLMGNDHWAETDGDTNLQTR